MAAFIDDHVANAIVQRNEAIARADRAEAAIARAGEPVAWGFFSSSDGCLSVTTEEAVAAGWARGEIAGISVEPLYLGPALASPSDREATDAESLEKFTAYFVKNYPGPNTVIHDPKWHAPRIFRAAKAALAASPSQTKGAEQ
ncbi:hypothetical protein EN788_48665 [Mesorhizobium sp. M2D.F.Ca.ET.145.01.1.1]|nr:hypothetical protein EN788_48665 [Mesorhizobium sp. M2D.F.Ca.ET.145.01.1.1]